MRSGSKRAESPRRREGGSPRQSGRSRSPRRRPAPWIGLFSWDSNKNYGLEPLIDSAVVPTDRARPVELLLLPHGTPKPAQWASYLSDLGPERLPLNLVRRHFSPYDMTVSWRELRASMPDFARLLDVPDEQPIYMESIYQALKVLAYTPANQHRTQHSADKAFPERRLDERLDGLRAARLTGRQALQATAAHVASILTHTKKVRKHWHAKVEDLIVGSIDPWNLDAPLLDYGAARAAYIKLFRFFYRSAPQACDLVVRMVRLARTGHPLILVETDAYAQGGHADVTHASKELLRAAASSTQGKLGHSMVLAWDLLHFVEAHGLDADAVGQMPPDQPVLPVARLAVGWRDALPDVTLGQLAAEGQRRARQR